MLCPEADLELLNGKWTSRIIFELQKSETIRFGQLKRNLKDITNTMLSSILKSPFCKERLTSAKAE